MRAAYPQSVVCRQWRDRGCGRRLDRCGLSHRREDHRRDCEDAYRIRSVAIYLSGQALLVRWPSQPLVAMLVGGKAPSLSELRGSFREAVLAARAGLI